MDQHILQTYQESSNLVFDVIKQTFPFLSEGDFLSFEEKYTQYYDNLSQIGNDRDFFINLRKFVVSIRNSHTRLSNIPNQKIFMPNGYNVIIINNRFYLQDQTKIIGEIISIDSRKFQDILREKIDLTSGSTKQFITKQALKNIFVREKTTDIKLVLKSNGRIIKKTLSCRTYIFKEPKQAIDTHVLGNNSDYIKIPTWIDEHISEKKLIDKLRETMIKDAQLLIIDVRGNSGGNSNIARSFASHFFNKKVLFNTAEQRASKDNFKLMKKKNFVDPTKPYYDIPIIILIDSLCFSSNEYFIAGMKDNKRAILIGETTGGGSGNPRKLEIPFRDSSFSLFVSTWNYYRPNGELLEGNGIKPDIVVRPTLDGLKKGRDEVLEKAIEEANKLLNINI